MASSSPSFSWKKISVVLKKAVAVNSKPTTVTFPELPTVLIWLRLAIAVSYGAYLGLNKIRSPTQPLQGLNLITFIPIVYARFYLGAPGVDDPSVTEETAFGLSLVFSGTINALAAFLLVWIYFFTAAHPEAEAQLTALLIQTAVAGAGQGEEDGSEQSPFDAADSNPDAAAGAGAAMPTVGGEESEF